MESCLYEGHVEHRRLVPVRHEFRYRLFMAWLDLGELGEVFRGRWLWSTSRPAPLRFRRSDYPGPEGEPLDRTIRALVEQTTGRDPGGPVRLLTHLRHFGIGFNPVSFFYCYDRGGARVEAVVAHVTSTPWGETHSYVVAREEGQDGDVLRASAAKRLHVSPFLPMELTHEFRFAPPGRTLEVAIADRCASGEDEAGSPATAVDLAHAAPPAAGEVAHRNEVRNGSLPGEPGEAGAAGIPDDRGRDARAGRGVFAATLSLRRREITTASLASMLLRHPAMTATVLGGIYLQALRLWTRGVPIHPHPGSRTAEAPTR